MTDMTTGEGDFVDRDLQGLGYWDRRPVTIERRLAALPVEVAQTSERRVEIRRDAVGEFVGDEFRERDERMAALEARVAALQAENAELRRLLEQQQHVRYQA